MRNKRLKKLRSKMNLKLSAKDGYKADYRVSKEVKKVVYFDQIIKLTNGKTIKTGKKVAVQANRQSIVNAKKLAYRRVKKEFKQILNEGKKVQIK
jgi:hypothetical protein